MGQTEGWRDRAVSLLQNETISRHFQRQPGSVLRRRPWSLRAGSYLIAPRTIVVLPLLPHISQHSLHMAALTANNLSFSLQSLSVSQKLSQWPIPLKPAGSDHIVTTSARAAQELTASEIKEAASQVLSFSFPPSHAQENSVFCGFIFVGGKQVAWKQERDPKTLANKLYLCMKGETFEQRLAHTFS